MCVGQSRCVVQKKAEHEHGWHLLQISKASVSLFQHRTMFEPRYTDAGLRAWLVRARGLENSFRMQLIDKCNGSKVYSVKCM